jgi:hypothetical protein
MVDQMQLIAPQVLDRRGVGGATKKHNELANHAQIPLLRLRCESAHAHVVDHALAQWADNFGRCGHRSAPVE